ncbi:MAG: hypothetical protein K6B44_11120 [Lachnospiraceae bacterium]|nr:hypothetical protein [Lachnospiraceae bacterium]
MNVIATGFAFSFAYDEKYGTSAQLSGGTDLGRLEIYMKNMIVSLISIKRQNPDDEVMLIVNTGIPEVFEKYAKLLKYGGVVIRTVEYDCFRFPEDFPWSLAAFKLCVLKYLSEQEYERAMIIDCDTYTVHPYTELWKEADQGLMLYNLGHSYDHEERVIMRKTYERLYPEGRDHIVHYGGEFICGRREDLKLYADCCKEVYDRMEETGFDVDKVRTNDETVMAFAAAEYKKTKAVIESGAYICRYWTDKKFYLVSTNAFYNPVCIWHLPSEKNRGLLIMYEQFIRNKAFPEVDKAAKIFGIVKGKRPYPLATAYAQWVRERSKK